MTEPMFDNDRKGLCIMCSVPTKIEGRMTCSEKCHEEFVKFGEKKFGITKKVVDSTTGITYQIPTRIIIEKGLTWKDLTRFPVWEEKEE